MGVYLCQACRLEEEQGGLLYCKHPSWPDAVQCAHFQPEPGPSVHAESGAGLPWDGIAFADVAQ